jgi:uncharacterized protein YlxW (UPF0749 family)
MKQKALLVFTVLSIALQSYITSDIYARLTKERAERNELQADVVALTKRVQPVELFMDAENSRAVYVSTTLSAMNGELAALRMVVAKTRRQCK